MWLMEDNPPALPSSFNPTGKAFVDLVLNSSDEDTRVWPHSFEFHLRVALTSDGNLIRDEELGAMSDGDDSPSGKRSKLVASLVAAGNSPSLSASSSSSPLDSSAST